jgi:hypothetical protein
MQMFRAVDRARALNMGRKAQHLTRQFSLLRPGALLPVLNENGSLEESPAFPTVMLIILPESYVRILLTFKEYYLNFQ